MKLYRPAIPILVKLDVIIRQEGKCGCGCGEKLGTLKNTEFDHCPALALRAFDSETRAFDPPANDPARIVAKTKEHHGLKTNGKPHTSYGSDKHAIAKIDRITGRTGNGLKKKIQSRGFSKEHQPFRREYTPRIKQVNE